MGTYAATGVGVGLFAFCLSYMIRCDLLTSRPVPHIADCYRCSLTSLSAGFNMFKSSLSAVLHSPVSFFDTTPMGKWTCFYTVVFGCLMMHRSYHVAIVQGPGHNRYRDLYDSVPGKLTPRRMHMRPANMGLSCYPLSGVPSYTEMAEPMI